MEPFFQLLRRAPLFCSKKTPGCAGGSGSFKLWSSILFFIEVKEMLPEIKIDEAGNRIRNNRRELRNGTECQ